MQQATTKTGSGQVMVLVVLALVLVAGYVAMDRYTDGQKAMLTAETRGLHMVQALSRYKEEVANYPDSLDKLAPKFTPAVSKRPDGAVMAYQLAGDEYILSCQNIVFKAKPYTYDSRTKAWTG